jgi:hypothetical protein
VIRIWGKNAATALREHPVICSQCGKPFTPQTALHAPLSAADLEAVPYPTWDMIQSLGSSARLDLGPVLGRRGFIVLDSSATNAAAAFKDAARLLNWGFAAGGARAAA